MELETKFVIGELLDLGCVYFEVKSFGGSNIFFLKSCSKRADCFFNQGDKIDVKGITCLVREIADNGRLLCLAVDRPENNKEQYDESI